MQLKSVETSRAVYENISAENLHYKRYFKANL